MNNQNRAYIYMIISAVVMGFMIFSLVQMQGYANIINDSGIVRGGTQRLVKLELMDMPSDDLNATIEGLLLKLQTTEDNRSFRQKETEIFKENLAAVREIWTTLKGDIDAYRQDSSEENKQTLMRNSEEHFKRANDAVFSAQYRAENELKRSLLASIAAFLIFAILVVVIESRGRREVKRVFYTDHLTGMPNQQAFEEKANALLSSNPEGTYFVVRININNFKFVNNSYGFDVGDKLLLSLAAAMEDFCGRDEACSRLHADHFALLIKKREHLSERLQTLLSETIKNEKSLNFSDILTGSCGVYHAEIPGESAAACIGKANQALKEGLPNAHHCAFYDRYLLNKITVENNLTRIMHESLSKEEFDVYLQPKVNFRNLEIIGAESLVRWHSEEYGFLTPDSFIPLFEKNGFIVSLDFYVLEKSCAILQKTLKSHPETVVFLSVNVSRVTLFQDDFIQHFASLVDQYDIPHRYIEIEITETIFILDTETVVQILNQMRALGFKIAIDDFGAGYSSLKILKDLPVDVIKIDRDFLKEGLSQERAYAIIKSVVEMAHSLDMIVVCEGVETLEHVHFLKNVNCAIGQGYYFSKPIPLSTFQHDYQRLLT